MAALGRGIILMGKQLAKPFGCTAEVVLSVLSGKWKTIILCQLNQRPCRYSELRGAILGLSDKMLTQRLHELISSGLVTHRHVASPPTGTYALTSKGKLLNDLLQSICMWGQLHSRACDIEPSSARPCGVPRKAR
jgi:DNA-binding HxlR family transcriptional regulator